jgi:nucleotide-binding universal stress UspA family protein
MQAERMELPSVEPVFAVRRIVVGLDGSVESLAAARASAVLACAFSAEVIGVHATGLLEVWPTTPEDGRNTHAHVREQLHGRWSEPLREGCHRLHLDMRDGSPADVLLAVAAETEADLLVVGDRGIGDTPLGELGSTSGKIVRRSTRPVLVVPVVQRAEFPASGADDLRPHDPRQSRG